MDTVVSCRKEQVIPLTDAQRLQALTDQGKLLANTPESALGQFVPAVPEWTAEDVLRHTAQVHRWVVEVLRAGPRADLQELSRSLKPSPTGPAAISHYQQSLDALLAEFARHDGAHPAISFVGPATVGWWIRRQTHEVLIHRHDAESAHAAEPSAASVALALDGVGEWLENFTPRLRRQGAKPVPESLVGRTLALVATDAAHDQQTPGHQTANRWTLRPGEGFTHTPATEPSDATLALPAWDLLLTVWRRTPLDLSATTGEIALVTDLLDFMRI